MTIVEWIVMIAVVLVIAVVALPVINESMSQTNGQIADGDTVQQTKEVTEKAYNIVIDWSDIAIGVISLFAIVLIIGGIYWVIGYYEQKRYKARYEKRKQEQEKEKRWKTTWEDIKEQCLLSKELEHEIERVEQQLSTLIPLLEKEKWDEEMYTMIRMKEEEIPLLLNRYATLTKEERKEEIGRLETTIHTMKDEVIHTEQMLQNVKRNEYEQTVRVIETRYDKRKQNV